MYNKYVCIYYVYRTMNMNNNFRFFCQRLTHLITMRRQVFYIVYIIIIIIIRYSNYVNMISSFVI